ncbi:hypothetical protein GYMLUDRAFT_67049 [Collybiopsis luxurians FD-317 M1]|nr:hypothetical protein GYMLUDRAFT_67049 [Collybiopsis luxurians FD-317 M1]
MFPFRVLPRYASTSTTAAGPSPNQRILYALEQAKAAELDRDDRSKYRVRSLNKAIKEVGYLDYRMSSPVHVEKLEGISSWVKKALVDLIQSQNSLFPSLEKNTSISTQSVSQRSRDEARTRSLTELQSVPGIGRKTANNILKLGIDSVAQLRASLHMLTDSAKPPSSRLGISSQLEQMLTKRQLTYLKYFEYIVQPVTRPEVERVASLIKNLLPPEYDIACVGAYRRGFPIANRIDLCLFHPDVNHVPTPTEIGPPASPSELAKEYAKTEHRGRLDKAFSSNFTPSLALRHSRLLNEVIPSLQLGGMIGGKDLSEFDRGQWKWTGVMRVPESPADGEEQESRKQRRDAFVDGRGTFRRADLNLVPFNSRATALLFLTGDSEFVRDMRMRASRMGLFLNEFGLWKWEIGAEDTVPAADSTEEPSTRVSSPHRRRGRPPKSPPPADGKWILIPTPSESILFAELGLDYVPPEKRNYAYLLSRFAKKGMKGWRGGEEQAPLTVLLNDR